MYLNRKQTPKMIQVYKELFIFFLCKWLKLKKKKINKRVNEIAKCFENCKQFNLM